MKNLKRAGAVDRVTFTACDIAEGFNVSGVDALFLDVPDPWNYLTQARAAMMGAKTPAERIAANNQLEGALGRLFVIVENYPNLKSDENFLRLQDELAGTENRIAVERRRYNEAVQKYNTDIELFPKNIAASMFGFQRENAYFTAEANAKDAPKVKF